MNITDKDLKANIGKKIKECRQGMELTQLDMANKLGVTQNAFSSWENGRTQPSQTTLVSLAAFFGVDYQWLACIETEPSQHPHNDHIPNDQIIEVEPKGLKPDAKFVGRILACMTKLSSKDFEIVANLVNALYEAEQERNKK